MSYPESKPIRSCTQCGRALPDETPESKCPYCLFGLGQALLEVGVQTPPEEAGLSPSGWTGASSDLPGLPRIFGDYELLELLGRGGMGVVYKARQISLDRLTAIKMIRAGPLPGADLPERFHREAQTVARLHHPSIVGIHEVGEVDGQPYFSMEYVEGGSLAERARAHPLPAKQAGTYVRSVAEAIEYAHQQGVLHRDLKPSNILLDQLDQPKVTDFGVAKLLRGQADLTLTDQRIGSPSYMAPEQASGHGERVDARTDVYALGTVLYHLVSGRPPFIADTVERALAQVVAQDPIPLRRLNPSLSRDLETICLKCLEKEPAKRYATARDLAEDLERFLQDEPILARPVTRVEKAWRWGRRNPLPASLGTAAMLLLLTVAIGGSMAAARQAALVEQNRRVFYGAELAAAWQSWDIGNIAHSIELLERHKPRAGQVDLREFTWGYLWNLCRPAVDTPMVRDPTSTVLLSAVSRDGIRFATSGIFGAVTIWNVKERAEEYRIDTGNARAGALAFSPDGRHLVSTGGNRAWGVRGDFQVWDIATGEIVARKSIPSFSGEYSSNGRWFAFASWDEIVVLDVQHDWSPIRHWSAHDESGAGVRWSKDGTRLVSAGGRDHTAAIWDAASGEERCRLVGHALDVTDAAFSPDGRRVATCGTDKTVRFWDAATGSELKALGYSHAAWVMAVTWSSDGTWVASASADGLVRVRNWITNAEWTLRGHSQTVPTLHFALDDTILITTSLDGSIRFWELAELPPRNRLMGREDNGRFSPIAFSSDNRWVATVDTNATNVLLWEVATGTLQSRIPILAPDLQKLLPSAGADVVELRVDGLVFTSEDRLAVACGIRQDGVEAGPWLKRIAMVDLQSETLTRMFSGGAPLQLSPDGKLLAMEGEVSGSVQIRELASGQTWPDPSMTRPAGSIWLGALAFSPDGDALAVSYSTAQGYRLALFETATGELLGEFAGAPFRSPINALAFTTDQEFLLTAGFNRRVQIWDVDRLTLDDELEGHSNHVRGLALSPDGRTLATGSDSGVIKFWSVGQREELLTVRAHERSVLWLTFSPDGHTLASGGQEGQVRLWRAMPE